jgi:hypothetical protein
MLNIIWQWGLSCNRFHKTSFLSELDQGMKWLVEQKLCSCGSCSFAPVWQEDRLMWTWFVASSLTSWKVSCLKMLAYSQSNQEILIGIENWSVKTFQGKLGFLVFGTCRLGCHSAGWPKRNDWQQATLPWVKCKQCINTNGGPRIYQGVIG